MKRRRKPKEYDAELAGAWFAAVVHPKATCVVCSSRKGLQGHHVVEKAWLEQVARRLKLDNAQRNELIWSPDNGIALCASDHERHTTAYRRVPRYLIGGSAWKFVGYVNALLGTEEASVRVERQYPAA